MWLVLHSNEFEYVANGILMMTMLSVPVSALCPFLPPLLLSVFCQNVGWKKDLAAVQLLGETLTALELQMECLNLFLNSLNGQPAGRGEPHYVALMRTST